jgi:hypothetical protein
MRLPHLWEGLVAAIEREQLDDLPRVKERVALGWISESAYEINWYSAHLTDFQADRIDLGVVLVGERSLYFRMCADLGQGVRGRPPVPMVLAAVARNPL